MNFRCHHVAQVLNAHLLYTATVALLEELPRRCGHDLQLRLLPAAGRDLRREAMGQLVENLKAFPNLVAQIEAGAGAGDPSRRRQEIAQQRAALLARELEKSGVRPDQIVVRASAEQRRAAGIMVTPRP